MSEQCNFPATIDVRYMTIQCRKKTIFVSGDNIILLSYTFTTMNNYYPNPSTIGPFDEEGPPARSRGVAGLLAHISRLTRVQYFYLGRTGGRHHNHHHSPSTCGSARRYCGLSRGILMIVMNEQEFEQAFISFTTSSFPCSDRGAPAPEG